MAKMIEQKETSWCRGDARAAMAWKNGDQEQRKEARVSVSVAMDLRKYVRNIIQSRPDTTLSLPTSSAGHVHDDTNQWHTKRGCVSKHTSIHTGKVTASRGESKGISAIDAHNRDDSLGEGGWRTLHHTRPGGGAPPSHRLVALQTRSRHWIVPCCGVNKCGPHIFVEARRRFTIRPRYIALWN